MTVSVNDRMEDRIKEKDYKSENVDFMENKVNIFFRIFFRHRKCYFYHLKK